jgi:hypothetical protein
MRARVAVVAALACAACASTPQRSTCPSPAAAARGDKAQGSVWPSGGAVSVGESLLEHVPDAALAAVILRRGALAPVLDWLDRAQVVVEARGDLDCDDTFSSYRITGTVGAQGLEFVGPAIENETE